MCSSDIKKNELKPWLKKEWVIPPKANAEFVCNMEDVLGVYQRPYDKEAPMLCMDETSKQLTKETVVPIKAKSGSVEKYDTEYERNGTANIFMVYEPLTGQRITKVTKRRTKKDWAYLMRDIIDNDYKDTKKIVLVMDNLNTHNKSSFYEAFEPKEAKRLSDKIEFHYTPKHGSWLNMAEIELSHLSRQCLDRRIEDINVLKKEVKAWNNDRNLIKAKTNWRFTNENARIKLKKLYPVI